MGKIRTVKDDLTLRRARALRREQTGPEARLWDVLRARRLEGWKWRRQVPVGPYIVDFLCREAGLAVEVDGGQHDERAAYDARRTAYLEAEGLRVLRFWNVDVQENLHGVVLAILEACDARAGGRGGG